MLDADRGEAQDALDGDGLRIGIVRARFNDAITRAMAEDCRAALEATGVRARDIRQVDVPGALEIPVALAVMADSEDFDALVAIGCVIRGETYHFEIVSDQSAAGIMRVSLEHSLPIANAVITVENEAQAQARAGTHGGAAARVAIEMVNRLDEWL
jgi:6,7-dimethyl-8-ribityllumazine synthase